MLLFIFYKSATTFIIMVRAIKYEFFRVSMFKLIDVFLWNKNLITYRTMLTLGKTGACTGGSYRFVCYLGMTKCVYGYMFFAYLHATYRAIDYVIV